MKIAQIHSPLSLIQNYYAFDYQYLVLFELGALREGLSVLGGGGEGGGGGGGGATQCVSISSLYERVCVFVSECVCVVY